MCYHLCFHIYIFQNVRKEEKEKTDNMVVNVTKIFQKMKNKSENLAPL